MLRDIKLFEEKESKTETDIKHIAEKNKELVSLRKKTMEGVLLRSKARWVAEGEKISKYFCNLEKRHYVSKQMIKLIDAKGEEIKEQLDINKEVNNFYSNLYKAKVLEECEIEQLVTEIPKLSEEESRSLEGKITIEEAGTALKKMKHEKSPGTDGFGAEFFKCFWKQLGPFVVRALNKAFEDGELSTTQKEGIITCILKGDKPRDNIKNWRPISLLNDNDIVIYKIGSSCITNRIKRVLPSLIDDDQTGFISNRYMGDNIRLIYDLINYLNIKNKPGLLLCFNFEKVFDSLDWQFMFRALRAFGFGKDLCRWIDTFLTFNSCTSSIKQYIKKSTILISNNMADEVNISLSTIYSAPKGARLYYNVLVNNNCMPSCCLKWSEKLKSNISWNKDFIKVQKIKN